MWPDDRIMLMFNLLTPKTAQAHTHTHNAYFENCQTNPTIENSKRLISSKRCMLIVHCKAECLSIVVVQFVMLQGILLESLCKLIFNYFDGDLARERERLVLSLHKYRVYRIKFMLYRLYPEKDTKHNITLYIQTHTFTRFVLLH